MIVVLHNPVEPELDVVNDGLQVSLVEGRIHDCINYSKVIQVLKLPNHHTATTRLYRLYDDLFMNLIMSFLLDVTGYTTSKKGIITMVLCKVYWSAVADTLGLSHGCCLRLFLTKAGEAWMSLDFGLCSFMTS